MAASEHPPTAAPLPEFGPADQLCVNTLRTLAIDAVQKANSGHPGAPMGLAPVAYALWHRFYTYDPADPLWPNRDRFVLSNGHASMLQYALIHLAGVRGLAEHRTVTAEEALPLEQLKQFRQLGSKTAGHPEHELCPGVETTTGPLGQGVANSVGMAIAQRWAAARYGRPGFESLFDHKVYAICGDGCMMEGVASEAASLAGHLKLSNLCWIYDDNSISIDGHTSLAFTEDVCGRFMAYGWNVLRVYDGNDMSRVARALETFRRTTDRPTFIAVKTHIGYGAPNKQDTKEAHGEPLGAEEVKAAKRFYGWPEDAQFLVPDGVYEHFRGGVAKRGGEAHAAWTDKFAEYKKKFPDLSAEVERMQRQELPAGWDKDLPTFPADPKGLATRDSGGKVINAVAKTVPWLVGGSADLNPSTKTFLKEEGTFTAANPAGRNIHFGVREHAMGAIMTGMTLCDLRGFGSGFMIFSDYGRPAIRLAALQRTPVIYVFTHDSIGVGEDGPTHQPIEQLASLRAIPGLLVIRPCDANEVTEAWRVVMNQTHEPAVLALTRQPVPTFDRTKYAAASNLAKGGYVLADVVPNATPEVILIGTGSEVQLCVAAYEKLAAEGVKARVVSLPSWELFEKQPIEYRNAVLPPAVTARVTVEMGSVFGWERYAGISGKMIGMHTFGASAPLKDLLPHFGFTVDKLYEAAKGQVKK
ncbi:MAG: transketolase [Gemmataceae bacterium]